MALDLEFALGVYMPLVDGVQDDGNDPVFQYIMISSKCYCAFPSVFATQDAVASMHPLAGLREFADIHCNYQCDCHTVNASCLEKELCCHPETAQTANALDQQLDGRHRQNRPRTGTSALWLQRADTMQTRNNVLGYIWSELFDLVQSHLAADALKEDSNDEASAHATLKKRKTVSTDGAP
eukprot:145145-Rhodomonas_salina.1